MFLVFVAMNTKEPQRTIYTNEQAKCFKKQEKFHTYGTIALNVVNNI